MKTGRKLLLRAGSLLAAVLFCAFARCESPDIPEFSVPAGFYDEPFALALSCAEGSELWYTLDCSDPRTSQSAQLYTDAPPALLQKAVENEGFAQRFCKRYAELTESIFAPERVLPLAEAYEAKLTEVFYDTVARFGLKRNDMHAESLVIQNFYRKRPQYALRYARRFCSMEDDAPETEHTRATLYENADFSLLCRASSQAVLDDSTPHSALIRVEKTGGEGGFVQYRTKLALAEDRLYHLCFTAEAEHPFAVAIQENGGAFETFYRAEFPAAEGAREIEVDFDAYRASADARILILCGYEPGEYRFGNIRLYEDCQSSAEPVSYPEGSLSLWCHASAKAETAGSGGIRVVQTDGVGWHVQYRADAALLASRQYTLLFTAEAGQPFAVSIQESGGGNETFVRRDFPAADGERQLALDFTLNRDCEQARIQFLCGYEPGEYRFRDIVLLCGE